MDESSGEEEGITAIRLLQRSANSASDEPSESEDDGVLMGEGEELEEIDESAFGRLMASATHK